MTAYKQIVPDVEMKATLLDKLYDRLSFSFLRSCDTLKIDF